MPNMTSEINIQKLILITATLVMAGGPTYAQQFRQPSFPAPPTSSPQQGDGTIQGKVIRGNLGTSDRFVPKTSDDSLGFVPVRPRSGEMGAIDPQVLGSRSSQQERILEQIREGNFSSDGPSLDRQSGPQIIRKRYDNGKDQLVRQVMQDEEGNFFNHGPWQLFNRRGDLMASGQFDNGLMDGTWERWHMSNFGGIFATKPFTEFDGPFISTATFSKGKLDGVWVISDRYRKKIVEVPYRGGKRNGTATWWYPSSQRMRVITFNDGVLDGPMYEWDANKKLVRNDEFIKGQKVIRQRTMYRPRQPSSESYYLEAELSLESQDNWWDAQPAEYVQLGQRVQHGPTFAWHSNGLRKMTGQYNNNTRVGQFTWWHENGQRALNGRYDDDGLKTGAWTWWHDNGMKSISGIYDADKAIGQWTWWDEDGQVTQREDFGEDAQSNGVLSEPNPDADDNETSPTDESEADSDETQPPKEGIENMEEISPLNLDEDASNNEDDSNTTT